MLKCYRICEGRIAECDEGAAQILIFINPENGERRRLVSDFNLDEHTLQSALDPDEPSRLEFEPDHMAAIISPPLNYSSKDQFLFKVTSLGLFLFKDRLVIVMSHEDNLFEGKAFQKLSSLRDLMLKIVHSMISHFMGHLKAIHLVSEEIEDRIGASMENRYLLNMFTIEKSLVYYLSAIHGNGVVIEKMKMSAAKIGFTPDCMEFLDDLIIENNQGYRQAEIYSSIIASLMDARASIVNNNLNIQMRSLTMIMIAFTWPVLVSSFFAMNVQLPMPQSGTLVPFFTCVVLAFGPLVALLLYHRLREKKSAP